MNKEYLEYWIKTLISKELKKSLSFEEWIKGFESRYSKEDLILMKELWEEK